MRRERSYAAPTADTRAGFLERILSNWTIAYRAALPRPNRWLPFLGERGYDFRPPEVVDLALAKDVVRRLIDRFNTMIERVAGAYPNVHHVNLTGTLAQAYGNDYTTHWNNELHPKENGFDLLAKLIQAKLKSLNV